MAPDTDRRAEFILAAAVDAGIKLGTNGDDLLMVTPRGMPRESRQSFSRAIHENQYEIMKLILQEDR